MSSGIKRYKAGKIGQTGVSAEIDLDLRTLQMLLQKFPRGANKISEQIATKLRDRIIQSFEDSPATGRRYGAHIASSPGNPPRIYTGRLKRSANIVTSNILNAPPRPEKDAAGNPIPPSLEQIAEIKKGERQGEHILVFRARHAFFLEFGTPRMAARPFMRPAIHKYLSSGQFTRDVQNYAKQLLKESAR